MPPSLTQFFQERNILKNKDTSVQNSFSNANCSIQNFNPATTSTPVKIDSMTSAACSPSLRFNKFTTSKSYSKSSSTENS